MSTETILTSTNPKDRILGVLKIELASLLLCLLASNLWQVLFFQKDDYWHDSLLLNGQLVFIFAIYLGAKRVWVRSRTKN